MGIYVFDDLSESSNRCTGIRITKDGFVVVRDILGKEYEVSPALYMEKGYQPDLSDLPRE